MSQKQKTKNKDKKEKAYKNLLKQIDLQIDLDEKGKKKYKPFPENLQQEENQNILNDDVNHSDQYQEGQMQNNDISISDLLARLNNNKNTQDNDDDQQQELIHDINKKKKLKKKTKNNNLEQQLKEDLEEEIKNQENQNQKQIQDLEQNIQFFDANLDTENKNFSSLKKQYEDLTKRTKLLKEPDSAREQKQTERKANYQFIKNDTGKWLPIIKRNREADHLDFTDKTPRDTVRINTVMGKELQNNAVAQKIENKLKEMNQANEQTIKQKEKQLLLEMDPKEAKLKQNLIAKTKNLLFYKELKNKKIAKIKSKLYHKIKKKRIQKENLKKLQELDPSLQQDQIEKLKIERARERISQIHSSKSKSMRNLLRYGDKTSVQQTINDQQNLRQQILRKVQEYEEKDIEEFSEEYDDENFREQAIKDLEKEILENEDADQQNDNNKGVSALKFIDRYNQMKNKEAVEEAKNIIKKLQNNENLNDEKGILSEEDLVSDEEEQKKIKKKKQEQQEQQQNNENDNNSSEKQQFLGRQVFEKEKIKGKKGEEIENEYENSGNQKLKNQNIKKILLDSMQEEEKKNQNGIQFKQNISNTDKNKKDQILHQEPLQENKQNKQTSNNKINQTNQQQQQSQSLNEKPDIINQITEKSLTQGINLKNLKKKYQKEENQKSFNQKDLEAFNIENKEEIYKDLQNFNIFVDDENEQNFLDQKFKDYEEQLPEEVKPLVGWGSWTGIGIQQKKLPTKEELLKKKIIKIQQLKTQRQDGKMDNVIMNEKRNKLVTQYFVKELPHPYQNSDQFNFITNTPTGPEWTTYRSSLKLTKPKILTRPGDIIKPIQLPKHNANKKN